MLRFETAWIHIQLLFSQANLLHIMTNHRLHTAQADQMLGQPEPAKVQTVINTVMPTLFQMPTSTALHITIIRFAPILEDTSTTKRYLDHEEEHTTHASTKRPMAVTRKMPSLAIVHTAPTRAVKAALQPRSHVRPTMSAMSAKHICSITADRWDTRTYKTSTATDRQRPLCVDSRVKNARRNRLGLTMLSGMSDDNPITTSPGANPVTTGGVKKASATPEMKRWSTNITMMVAAVVHFAENEATSDLSFFITASVSRLLH
ncbi:hypothetical protein CC86DRAFT_451006 [Ophiobolus disseminans]|uniref:Uncharacterized protein n=1 Tax=Ophiobolus disseminans TaxID=1469910 RepID=A0A6A7AJV5_9PLEO|nr:hypothetical protein CC86DRAFT_451006 [Ophiobolus disseminans]